MKTADLFRKITENKEKKNLFFLFLFPFQDLFS